jgi:hypothetical protein
MPLSFSIEPVPELSAHVYADLRTRQ